MLIYVAGSDAFCRHDGHGLDGDEGGPTAVHIGERNVIQADVYAPKTIGTMKALSRGYALTYINAGFLRFAGSRESRGAVVGPDERAVP